MNDVRQRVLAYFDHVGSMMTSSLEIARTFINPADIGSSRESTYINFIRKSLPSKLSVTFGGYVFDKFFEASPQLDIIVADENAFKFSSLDSQGDRSIVRLTDTLAFFQQKSIMKGRLLSTSKSGELGVNPNSDFADALTSVRKTNLLARDSKPLSVIFALDWDSASSLSEIAQEIIDYTQFMARQHQTSNEIEFNLLPDIIHIHNKALVFKARKGHVVAGMAFGDTRYQHGIYVGFQKPFVNVGFAMVCSEISRRLKSGSSLVHEEMMEALVDERASIDNDRARLDVYWIYPEKLWDVDKIHLSEFHGVTEIHKPKSKKASR